MISRLPLSTLQVDPALQSYVLQARAANTWRAYAGQWGRFETWCTARQASALPAAPEIIARYLVERAQAGAALASLEVMLAAIRFAHTAGGQPLAADSPALTLVMSSIRRRHVRPQRQAEPLRANILRELLTQTPQNARDLRDAALLAVLFIFALRPSEMVALDWQEFGSGRGRLRLRPDRIELTLLGSKAAAGRPERLAVPAADNPLSLAALVRWVAHAQIAAGEPLLRAVTRGHHVGAGRLHVGNVGSIIRAMLARHFHRTGMSWDAAVVRARGFSGHSGRLGMYVTACEAGVPPQHLAALGRHASLTLVCRYAAQADQLQAAPHRTPGVGV